MDSEDPVNTIPRGSIEYVTATVTADVDLTMPAEISVSRGTASTWLPATWVGEVGKTRTLRTTDVIDFSEVDYPAGTYTVRVRLTDSPEVPVIRAGGFSVY